MTAVAPDYPGTLILLGSMYLSSPAKETIERWIAAAGDPAVAAAPVRDALHALDPGNAQAVEALETEFSRLLAGPAQLPCPPFESVYTSEHRQMLQEAHRAVKALHAEAGMNIDDDRVMPDHIGAELLFLAALLDRLGEENDDQRQQTLAVADRLMDEHLNRWVGPFTNDLEKAARFPLYRALAVSTREVLAALQEE
jgi:putative dimethyl sulfoxide reductase chaperone